MNHYTPFLKAKRGELTAMSELAPDVKQAICPFFDFPRKNAAYNSDAYARTTKDIATGLKKHWGEDAEFYFDDFDIVQGLKVAGEHQYSYVLRALRDLQVLPVVGLGRRSHNEVVACLKRKGEIASPTVAFRAVRDDFEDFELNKDDIDCELGDIFRKFDKIDLILDCQFCISMDVSKTAQQIAAFANKFSKTYGVRRVIVTGSSIPASICDVLKVDSTAIILRRELAIIAKVRTLVAIPLVLGDYATVSPFYSEAALDPKILQNVMTPRVIYSFNHSHYVKRGLSMKSGGYEQYVGLTKELCGQVFFRGRGYSCGEKYFDDKRQRIGKNATNGTVVKPSIVAHVTYMVLGAKL